MAGPLIASGTVLLNPHHEIGATLGAVCERHDRGSGPSRHEERGDAVLGLGSFEVSSADSSGSVRHHRRHRL